MSERHLDMLEAHMASENPSSVGQTLRLRFTGTCDAREFAERCATHEYWYHSYYFDNGFEQRGDYDIGPTIESYGLPDALEGMDVLDVGTGSGWFATYFEQQGANVTTVDARGYTDFDVWGRFTWPDIAVEKPTPDRVGEDGQPIYFSPVSGGFWVMKDMLGLQARYVNARIYDITPELFGCQTFDLVFMGAVLMHLRDPLGALMAARSVCRGLLVANSIEPAVETPLPVMQFLNDETEVISWWAQNRACLAAMARGALQGGRCERICRSRRRPSVREPGGCHLGRKSDALAPARASLGTIARSSRCPSRAARR